MSAASTDVRAVASDPVPTSSSRADVLWGRVDELIDRAPDLWALRTHRLGLLAARRLGAGGRRLPQWLVLEQRASTLIALVTPIVLTHIRQACSGPVLVVKGPVVAARYPDEARSYNDLDILVPDAEAAHRALLQAGFVAVEDPDFDELDIRYHLQPLAWEKFPLRVEVHNSPNWPPGLKAPPVEDLFAHAVPDAALSVDGILTLHPAHHVMLLAGHGWTHRPLGALRDLIDVAAMAEGVSSSELAALADDWEMGRLWRTTWSAVSSLLLRERGAPWALRLWASHLAAVRERTVLENHVERWLSPYWALTPTKALAKSVTTFREELVPLEGETWGMKLKRVSQALSRAFSPRSEHEFRLGELAPKRLYGRFGAEAWRDRKTRHR